MISSRHDNAWMQSDFYRDQFRKMVRKVLVLTVLIILLTALVIYLVLVQPAQANYANTSEGKILPMPAMRIG